MVTAAEKEQSINTDSSFKAQWLVPSLPIPFCRCQSHLFSQVSRKQPAQDSTLAHKAPGTYFPCRHPGHPLILVVSVRNADGTGSVQCEGHCYHEFQMSSCAAFQQTHKQESNERLSFSGKSLKMLLERPSTTWPWTYYISVFCDFSSQTQKKLMEHALCPMHRETSHTIHTQTPLNLKSSPFWVICTCVGLPLFK